MAEFFTLDEALNAGRKEQGLLHSGKLSDPRGVSLEEAIHAGNPDLEISGLANIIQAINKDVPPQSLFRFLQAQRSGEASVGDPGLRGLSNALNFLGSAVSFPAALVGADEAAENIRRAFNINLGDPATGIFADPIRSFKELADPLRFYQFLFEHAPTTAALVGVYAASPVLGVSLMALGEGGFTMQEMERYEEDNNLELPAWKKTIVSLSVGGVNAALERFGLRALLGRGVFNRLNKRIINKVFLSAAGVLTEAGTEGIQEVNSELAKITYNEFAEVGIEHLWEKFSESFLASIPVSVVLGGGVTVNEILKERKTQEKLDGINEVVNPVVDAEVAGENLQELEDATLPVFEIPTQLVKGSKVIDAEGNIGELVNTPTEGVAAVEGLNGVVAKVDVTTLENFEGDFGYEKTVQKDISEQTGILKAVEDATTAEIVKLEASKVEIVDTKTLTAEKQTTKFNKEIVKLVKEQNALVEKSKETLTKSYQKVIDKIDKLKAKTRYNVTKKTKPEVAESINAEWNKLVLEITDLEGTLEIDDLIVSNVPEQLDKLVKFLEPIAEQNNKRAKLTRLIKKATNKEDIPPEILDRFGVDTIDEISLDDLEQVLIDTKKYFNKAEQFADIITTVNTPRDETDEKVKRINTIMEPIKRLVGQKQLGFMQTIGRLFGDRSAAFNEIWNALVKGETKANAVQNEALKQLNTNLPDFATKKWDKGLNEKVTITLQTLKGKQLHLTRDGLMDIYAKLKDKENIAQIYGLHTIDNSIKIDRLEKQLLALQQPDKLSFKQIRGIKKELDRLNDSQGKFVNLIDTAKGIEIDLFEGSNKQIKLNLTNIGEIIHIVETQHPDLAEVTNIGVDLVNGLLKTEVLTALREIDKPWAREVIDKIENHIGLFWSRGSSTGQKIGGIEAIANDWFRSSFVREGREGFLKERTINNNPIIIRGFRHEITQQIKRTSKFVGKHKAVNDAFDILGSVPVRQAISKIYKDATGVNQSIEQALAAYRGLLFSKAPEFEQVVRRTTRNLHTVALFKVHLPFLQFLSYPLLFTQGVPLPIVLKNFSLNLRKSTADKIEKWSPDMFTRTKFGGGAKIISPLEDHEQWSDMLYAGGDLLAGIKWGDKVVVYSSWEAIEEWGKGLGKSGDDLMQWTADKLLDVFNRTQPANSALVVSGLSLDATTSVLARFLTLFSSQRSQLLKMHVMAVDDVIKSGYSAKQMKSFMKTVGTITFTTAMVHVLRQSALKLLYTGLNPGDEEDFLEVSMRNAWWQLWGTFSAGMSSWIGVGPVLTTVGQRLVFPERKLFATQADPWSSFIGDAWGAFNNLTKGIEATAEGLNDEDRKEYFQKSLFDFNKVISIWYGIPISSVVDMTKQLWLPNRGKGLSYFNKMYRFGRDGNNERMMSEAIKQYAGLKEISKPAARRQLNENFRSFKKKKRNLRRRR